MLNDDYIKQVSGYFIEGIKNNDAPWMKPWKASEYIRPQNPESKSIYSGLNSLLLESMQKKYKSEDPRWLTFLQIRKNNYHLLKGSFGTPIYYFQNKDLSENKDNKEEDEEGRVGDDKDKPKNYKNVRKLFIVFHASQIEGLPPLVKKEKDIIKDSQKIDNVENLLTKSKAKIFHDSANSNSYNPGSDEIHLTPKHTFINLPSYYSTAIHELSHWTGHPSRLNRDMKGIFGSNKYAMEELRAEIGSYLICKNLDIDFNPQNTLSYISSWAKELKNTDDTIFKSVQDAVKINNFCMNFVNEKEKNIKKNNEKTKNNNIQR
jgi:antirestriction protein ArdC